MFGIRRSNVSYNINSDVIKPSNIIENTENINYLEKVEEDIYKSTKFIFYDDKKKFTNQIEIYISLTNYNNKKLLVIIGNESSLEQLNNQIIESLESFPEFKNINGIKVEGIYKINNDDKLYLPQEGKVRDFLNSGDILYCNLITDEYWIKTYFNIQSFNFKKIIKLEYKLKKKMRYKRFKLMLMKGGIDLFVENIKSSKSFNEFNYYIKLFEFKIKKHKKVITHNIHIKHKDKMTIDKIINFSSEIIVILKFELFEKLIHKNIKITKNNFRNNLRVNEYNELSFEEIINDSKFLPEFNAIKELSEEFLKNQYNLKNPQFLFFTKKISKKLLHKYFFPKKNSLIFDKKSIMEFSEEEDEKENRKILNSNLNIDEITTKRKNTFNSLKSNDNESIDSNNSNLEENKIVKKQKRKSLFYKVDKKEIESSKKEVKKKEKIKNMIIIAGFLIKEEKKIQNNFLRKATFNNFDNNFEFRKNSKNIKISRLSISNKNLAISDNKNNINYLMEEEEETKKSNFNNYKIDEKNEDEEFEREIEFESKPKTFSDKNVLQNDLFKSFNANSRNNSNKGLEELFLDRKEEDNDYETNIIKNNININKNYKTNNYNNKFSDLNEEGIESRYNLDEENIEVMNNIDNTQKSRRQTIGRRSTFIYDKKKPSFSALRNQYNPVDFYKEIKNIFNYDIFLNEIKKYFNNSCNKKIFDKIKMPQSKDIEYLDKEYKFLIETKRTKQIEELKFSSGEYHIYIFMTILFLFSSMIILCVNVDLMSVFY